MEKQASTLNTVSKNGDSATNQPQRKEGRENYDQSFLNELGLVGLEQIELPVLCTLVTGDPLLMVGKHGTAKTALAEAIAGAMGLRFHAYDASKALFEDIIGFPNPDELGQGNIDYVPTPLSLWDKEFILVDEISRANAQTQSKWLEVVRSRKVMGEKLPDLKYVFSAMNPPGEYEGARPLDPALAGRFAFVLEVPNVNQMKHEDRLSVVNAVGKDDAPMARNIFEQSCGTNGQVDLPGRIEAIRENIPYVQQKYGERVSRYLSSFVESLPVGDEGYFLDGRRLGMIRRNILVALAIRSPESDRPGSILKEVMFQSLPHPAVGEQVPEHRYELAHKDALSSLTGGRPGNGSETIEGKTLLRQALEQDTPREAIPDLASLSRLFNAYTDPDSNIRVESSTIERILHSGKTLIPEVYRTQCDIDLIRAIAEGNSPERSIAIHLLGWWIVEKQEEGNYRLDRTEAEEMTGYIGQLETKIRQLDEVNYP
ncbi:MAG: AAA family ATPase [bacterium]